MFNLKNLAKKIGVPANDLLKNLAIKHRRKFFCKYDGIWYEFKSQNDIIVPYEQAKVFAMAERKDLPAPININEIKTTHLTLDGARRIPTAVLLGHFNHGKTTLLDALGGSAFVDEEKHGITQVIRTQLVPAFGGEYLTIVDTPGQELFYRMRSYGASIADSAVLMVAADDGVSLQTEESIGIVEELGIPAVVCINKVDLPTVTPETLQRVREQLDQFVALSKVPIIEISAKNKLNLNTLLETIANIIKPKETRAGRQKARLAAKVREKDVAATTALCIAGTGTVLNIIKNRQHGTVLHVIVRDGEVCAGDWFSAGGWGGAVRALHHNDFPSRGLAPPAAENNKEKSAKSKDKGKGKDTKAKGKDAKSVLPAWVEKDRAGPGMAVMVLITLHEEAAEPRPIGDTVRFHRDAKLLRRAQQLLQEQLGQDGTRNRSVVPIAAPALGGTSIEPEPGLTPVSEDSFSTAKEAALYCMERGQMEVRLSAHAVSPDNAKRFGLERLCELFERQKIGFTGKADRKIFVDAEVEEDQDYASNDDTDEAGSDVGEADAGHDDEEGEEEEEEENDEDLLSVQTVIVKADSDVTLGTLVDRYEDEVAALATAGGSEAALSGSINHVVHWGIGEVGLKDVNMAKTGDALIVAYNVGVERSAARHAMDVNVRIVRFDHVQLAADAIVGKRTKSEDSKQ